MTQKEFDIAVFGASGATGRHVVSLAAEQGLKVLAIDHSAPPASDRRTDVFYAVADVLTDDLKEFIRSADAVISTLGVALTPTTAIDPPPLYTDGTRAILEAMQAAGTQRLSVISAAFVEEDDSLPTWFRVTIKQALRVILDQMREMETLIGSARNIQPTIARPGWLLEKPLTEQYDIASGGLPKNTIRTRHADLAHFLLRTITDDTWVGSTPFVGRAEDAFDESLLAASREIEKLIKKST
ncbi:MAG: NAD(P)H-binding protein [Pseudomonadota bacterium]